MKATAILRDFAESFFTGIIRYSDGSVSSVKGVGFDLMDSREKWEYCLKESVAYGSGKPRIPVKIGDGSFRDRVELNQILQGPHKVECSIAPRRGYLLATFEINPLASLTNTVYL